MPLKAQKKRKSENVSMEELIREVAEEIGLNKDNIRDFLNVAFEKVSDVYNVCEDYQRRAAIFGDAFEACFKIIMERFFPEIPLTPDVELPEACMSGVGKADFAVILGGIIDRKIIAIIEAKGGADHIFCDGKRIEIERPGLLRTDTVKKAICNAYQISRTHSEALFFIVTSHKPKSGNAKCMCDLAEGDIVDKIVDVTNYKELEEMAKMIREKISKIS